MIFKCQTCGAQMYSDYAAKQHTRDHSGHRVVREGYGSSGEPSASPVFGIDSGVSSPSIDYDSTSSPGSSSTDFTGGGGDFGGGGASGSWDS